MAKIYLERAYIEPQEPDMDNFVIEITYQGVLVGKVDLDNPKPWLYTVNNDDGDLVINNSAGMEANKWDHITKEIMGG